MARVWRGAEGSVRLRSLLVGNGCNLLSGDLSWRRLIENLSSSLAAYPHHHRINGHNDNINGKSHDASVTPASSTTNGSKEELTIEFDVRKPFSMVYEELYLQAMRKANKKIPENEVKGMIARMLEELPANDFHRKLVSSGFNHILTTNYDYNLEKCCGKFRNTSLAYIHELPLTL